MRFPWSFRFPSRILASLVLLTLLVAGLLYGIWIDYRRFLDTPLEVPADGLVLEVKSGMGIGTVARELQRRPGLSRPPFYLEIHAWFNGLAHRLKTGEYALSPGMSPRDVLDRIVAGRVIQYPLTVVEGWTFRQLRQALAGHPKIGHTLGDASDADIMARLDRPEQHPEGWFLPDTYYFPAGFSDEAFLRRALVAMERRLARAWSRRAADLPLNDPYQALILASIIEKESGMVAERPVIAGVFARRLRKGMLLQTDPTVIYGLGAGFEGDLRRRDLAADTPYNTYTRKGLPPTPIALPGVDALEAAVHPADGDALYFVADGQGGHVFSKTLHEHNRAVRRYRLRER